MIEREAEFVSLGIEAIPGGMTEIYGIDDQPPDTNSHYRQAPVVLHVEGLVAIALRWINGPPQNR